MRSYIDKYDVADLVNDTLENERTGNYMLVSDDILVELINKIESMPEIDSVEKGEWLADGSCSQCGYREEAAGNALLDRRYCPMCGSKMTPEVL